MAVTTAALTSAITASQMQFSLSSVTGTGLPVVGAAALPVGYPMLIDSELMFVISQPSANNVVVRGRGSDGTVAAPHDVLANVYTSPLPSDFPLSFGGTTTYIDIGQDLVMSVGQDSTIALPAFNVKNAAININKATAAALILPAPSLLSNSLTFTITSQTAAAHVITATSLLMDGTAAAPKSTATFVAGKGATVTLVAENGVWNVASQTGVAFT